MYKTTLASIFLAVGWETLGAGIGGWFMCLYWAHKHHKEVVKPDYGSWKNYVFHHLYIKRRK